MAYIKKIWKDYPNTTTQIKAEYLNNIENGIDDVDSRLVTAESDIDTAESDIDTAETNIALLQSGWININAIWTYSSWNAITKNGVINSNIDLTSSLSTGMKIKLTQSSITKYGVITALSSTQITIFMGKNFQLNTDAINNMYYSTSRNPYNFPTNVAIDDLIGTQMSLTASANQSIAAATPAMVILPTILNDTSNGRLYQSGNSIVIGSKISKINVLIQLQYFTVGTNFVYIYKNGVRIFAFAIYSDVININQFINVAEGDVITAWGYSSVANTISSSSEWTFLKVTLIG